MGPQICIYYIYIHNIYIYIYFYLFIIYIYIYADLVGGLRYETPRNPIR